MYCIHCGKAVKALEGTCEHCGQALVTHELDHDETRELNKNLHNRLNKSREEVDNAMVFVVLGATLFIVGFLFFWLSFKLPNAAAHSKVITINCFEFWVSMAGLGFGGVLLIIGLIRVIRQKAVVQKEIMRALTAVQSGHYHHLQMDSFAEE